MSNSDAEIVCIFGSTNNIEFLKDETGNRRWLSIKLRNSKRNKCHFKDLEQDKIDQIWAEAEHYYELGDKNILTQPESIEMASTLQEQHKKDNVASKGRWKRY